ncbi:MAG TPA: PLP-dependent aminotransferase family protein [Kineosporiaceae bacterium]|nr:PLP-dependent aminotransferase family protein [Kineosporiaceae bacterium]
MVDSQLPLQRVGVRELAGLLEGWRGTPGSHQAAPGYAALAQRLRALILDGRLPLQTLLPSERALADALATSRTTTTAAYAMLRETGFADSHRGRGTWTTLPGSADTGPDATAPWPVQHGDAISGTIPDLATASFEAPPQLHAAYAAALDDLPRYLPGHGYATAGLPALRTAIARRYTERGVTTRAEQILVTAGSTQALRLVFAALLSPGDRVVVEHPTWPLGVDAVRAGGGRPVAFAMEDGWDAGRLAGLVRSSAPRLAYLVPDFHNPTGRLMDPATRREVVEVLARNGCTVISDETTCDLDLRTLLRDEYRAAGDERAGRPVEPVLPLATLAGPGEVISLGSASKTFWGGLRIGWVRADTALVRRLTQLRAAQDLAGPVVEQLTATHLLAGIDPWLPQRRAEVARRCSALGSALARELPQWRFRLPDGGLSVWVRLPQPRSSQLVTAARALGLQLTPGSRFAADGGFETRIRLPFTRPVTELEAAVGILSRAWSGGAAVPDPEAALDPVV